jgi:hypothetical protein
VRLFTTDGTDEHGWERYGWGFAGCDRREHWSALGVVSARSSWTCLAARAGSNRDDLSADGADQRRSERWSRQRKILNHEKGETHEKAEQDFSPRITRILAWSEPTGHAAERRRHASRSVTSRHVMFSDFEVVKLSMQVGRTTMNSDSPDSDRPIHGADQTGRGGNACSGTPTMTVVKRSRPKPTRSETNRGNSPSLTTRPRASTSWPRATAPPSDSVTTRRGIWWSSEIP